MENPITLEELRLALSGMASGKAPGLDGIPREFYETFWDIIGPELLEMFQESLQVAELPLICRRAIVSLFPKEGETSSYSAIGVQFIYCLPSIKIFVQGSCLLLEINC